MLLNEFEEQAAIDRLEGWELIDFLQISTSDILAVLYEYDWINEENIDDVREFIGVKQ